MAVKEAFANVKTDSCTLVPLPSAKTAKSFVAFAESNVESAKLSDFRAKWGPVLAALPTTESAICLPSVETLDTFALAQAEVGRSFGFEESRRLRTYLDPTKGVLTQSAALTINSPEQFNTVKSLLSDAKQLTAATGPEKTAFRFAGSKVEGVVKREALAQQRADDAAKREAKLKRMAAVRE